MNELEQEGILAVFGYGDPMARRLGLSACILAVLLLIVAVLGSRDAMGRETPLPSVASAWVRLPVISGRPAAGYFLLSGTKSKDALLSATSPLAERVELHSVSHDGGVMKMRAESRFALPAGGKLAFEPGGNHLMIFGLKPVKVGERIPITLTFESGAKVTISAEARSAAATANDGHGH